MEHTYYREAAQRECDVVMVTAISPSSWPGLFVTSPVLGSAGFLVRVMLWCLLGWVSVSPASLLLQ